MLIQIIYNLLSQLKIPKKKISKKISDMEILNKRLADVNKNPITNDEIEKSIRLLYKDYVFFISESPSYKNLPIPNLNQEKYYEVWKNAMGINQLMEELPKDKLYYALEIKRKALKNCIVRENYWKYN